MKKKIITTLCMISVFALGMMGCQSGETSKVSDNEDTAFQEENIEEDVKGTDYASYIASIEEKSDNIKYSLENDVLTQTEMNGKTQELYELWDGALNYLWGEIKNVLSEEEFEELRDKQRSWISEKEKSVEDAGKEYEGGSLYPTIVNTKAAEITEKRVYELYELLK